MRKKWKNGYARGIVGVCGLHQKQVINLLCEGMTTSEIAEELGLSPKTVEYHRLSFVKRNHLPRCHPIAIFRAALKLGLTEI